MPPRLTEATCAFCGQVKPQAEWALPPWLWGPHGWVVCCLSCEGRDDLGCGVPSQ